MFSLESKAYCIVKTNFFGLLIIFFFVFHFDRLLLLLDLSQFNPFQYLEAQAKKTFSRCKLFGTIQIFRFSCDFFKTKYINMTNVSLEYTFQVKEGDLEIR